MAIKLVVNGYFRSGTTALWSVLKESNPELTVFYEPCHEKIPLILDTFGDQENPLHGKRLWDEYFKFPELRGVIRKTHPNIGMVIPDNKNRVIEYCDAYHELNCDCVLQVNRWHEFLGDIYDHYRAPYVHMIRNPFDVYRSFCESPFKNKDVLGRFKSHLLLSFLREDVFYVRETFRNLVARVGVGSAEYRGWKRKLKLLKFSRFQMFLFAWIFYNYQAILSTEGREGMVIQYENIADGRLSEFLGGRGFKSDGIDLWQSRRLNFISNEEVSLLTSLADELGLSREMAFILSKVSSSR